MRSQIGAIERLVLDQRSRKADNDDAVFDNDRHGLSEGRIDQKIVTALLGSKIVAAYPAGSSHNTIYARDFDTAFGKALVGAGMSLPQSGTAFVSVKDGDKEHIVPAVEKLLESSRDAPTDEVLDDSTNEFIDGPGPGEAGGEES